MRLKKEGYGRVRFDRIGLSSKRYPFIKTDDGHLMHFYSKSVQGAMPKEGDRVWFATSSRLYLEASEVRLVEDCQNNLTGQWPDMEEIL